MKSIPSEKTLMFFFAVFLIVLCFGYFFAVTFGNISDKGARYADLIVGALIGSATTILTFYFGSSKGSVDKGETIDTQIKNAADVAKDTAKMT
jgi:hypothetical protein